MNTNFKIGEYCIYNTHGVVKVLDIQTIEIGTFKSECMVLEVEKDKMKIQVPTAQIKNGCMRKMSTKSQMEEIFVVLSTGAKKIKGMWSRRAKEYEEKINSGDIIQIAELVKDLTRDIDEVERAYSERIIYDSAVYRLASELSMVEGITIDEAKVKIIETANSKVKFSNNIEKVKFA